MACFSKEQIIETLSNLIEEGNPLKKNVLSGYAGKFLVPGPITAWKAKVLTTIESVRIPAPVILNYIKNESTGSATVSTVDTIQGYIQSLIDLIDKEILSSQAGEKVDALFEIDTIFSKFHRIVRQLRTRHDNRPTLSVADEYDVQDLLHALLLIHFDDVRAEEWTPSYAGGATRMDFLLKEIQTVIEVKKTRPSMTAKSLGEELLIDREKYKTHPDCQRLYCFVYDPDGYLGNPAGIKRDLEAGNEGYITVCITPD